MSGHVCPTFQKAVCCYAMCCHALSAQQDTASPAQCEKPDNKMLAVYLPSLNTDLALPASSARQEAAELQG